jgi:hypothetical protein
MHYLGDQSTADYAYSDPGGHRFLLVVWNVPNAHI